MNLQEYRQLQAELGVLRKLLAELPPGREIESLGFESRIQEIEAVLANQAAPIREPIHARLTFRGKPIVGSYGIFAEFGASVVQAFSDAVAALGASQSGPLGTRGVIPGRDDYRMLITGTVPGSFGFQFEEAPVDSQTLFPEDSPLESAIDQTKVIMKATLGTDDELTEALADVDPRAIDAIREFLDTMFRNEAVCALDFKDDVFRFADVDQIRRSMVRLEQDNIHETDEEFPGIFLGVLPHRRTFEFKPDDTEEIISGKVGSNIADPTAINHVLEQRVIIRVHSRRVGEGRPRYVLLSYSNEAAVARSDGPTDV